MNINLSGVDWIFLGLMMGLAFVTALLGSLIAFRNRLVGAILAGILFGFGFVFWNYYPHDFGLPILKTTGPDSTMTTTVTTPPAAVPMSPTPMAPQSPVTTVPTTPPSAPPSTMAPTNPNSGNH